MKTTLIDVKIEKSVGVIALDNPPANCLSTNLLQELNTALDWLEADSECKVVVITGTGDKFAAGADINEIKGIDSEEKLTAMLKNAHRVFNRIENLKKPVIAAVNGLCMGGGTELILTCHMRLASEDATFALPEIRLGILPGYGGTQRLPRLINMGKAVEMILTGSSVGGEEAFRIGLVNKTVPGTELMAETMKLAHNLADKSRYSLTAGLKAIYGGRDFTLENGLKREIEEVVALINYPDMKEGLSAFLEKRKPNFG